MQILMSITFLITTAYAVVLILIRRGASMPSGKHAATKNRKLKLSVLIAARDEAENIANVLTDLCNQHLDKNDFEVIVIDDHSSDATASLAQNFKDKLNIQVLQLSDMRGKKGALKKGAENASHPILVFTDADVHIPPYWLSSLADHFESGADWVSGLVKTNISDSLFSIFQAYDQASLMAITHASFSLNKPGLASGANLAVKKNTYNAVGGFNYPPQDSSGDDVMLLDKVVASKKYQLEFSCSKNALISTAPAPSLKSFLEQRKRWASNSFYVKSSFIKFTMLAGGLANLWIIALIAFSLFHWQLAILLLVFFFIKALSEALAIYPTLRQMGQGRHFFYRFPLVALLHPFYIFTAGFLGTFAPHNWKGRIKKNERSRV